MSTTEPTGRAARFTTLPLADAECSPQWEAWNRRALVGVHCRTPDGRGLRGEEINLALPDVRLARVRAQGHRAVRDGDLIDATPSDSVVAYAVLRGRTAFASRAGGGRLGAGEATLVDGDQPFDRCFPTAFAELVLTVPRHTYAERFGPVRAAAAAGPVTMTGLAAVRADTLAHHLGAAAHPSVAASEPPDVAAVRTVALDLLGDLTGRNRPGDRLALARLLVDQHVADPTLSESTLADRLGVSTRHLSRLFAASGTSVPAFVTERRLVRAEVLLRAPDARPLADVAAACGFASASYFSRVFVRHRGLTPGRFRTA